MKFASIVFVLLVLLPVVSAAEPYHMTLLAAREENGSFSGSPADLYLEIQPGRGRVFLETFPLTRVDTQISTRFAKEIACNYFDLECDSYDFIYTIQSDSSIIGGPSAGAAIAALSTAAVLDVPIDEKVAVTGTINSGGLIGPVGGLKAKIDAAAQAGITTVLIPFGTRTIDDETSSMLGSSGQNDTNRTLDLVVYGEQKNITVLEVADLNDVVEHFIGKRLLDDNVSVAVDSDYIGRMKSISENICGRSGSLADDLTRFELNESDRERIRNQTTKAARAASENAYYSSASYCFGLNVQLKNLLYNKQIVSASKVMAKAAQLKSDVQRFEESTRKKELHTLTDLQAYAIVLERLDEAERYLGRVTSDTSLPDALQSLAYADERFYSAQQWATFFDIPGTSYVFNSTVLQHSCIEKLQEAKERVHYLELFLTGGIGALQEDIDRAEQFWKNESYEQCLITASEAKAHANAVLSTTGIAPEELPQVVDIKLAALEKHLSRTIEKRAFPLLGYSYYEYAQSLREQEPVSALLYADYGLELSNLDIYFEEDKNKVNKGFLFSLPLDLIAAVIVGFALGFGVMVLCKKRIKKKKRIRCS